MGRRRVLPSIAVRATLRSFPGKPLSGCGPTRALCAGDRTAGAGRRSGLDTGAGRQAALGMAGATGTAGVAGSAGVTGTGGVDRKGRLWNPGDRGRRRFAGLVPQLPGLPAAPGIAGAGVAPGSTAGVTAAVGCPASGGSPVPPAPASTSLRQHSPRRRVKARACEGDR